MPVKTTLRDTFEQLVELGVSTAKKTGQTVAQTFSPLNITEKIIHPDSASSPQSPELSQSKKGNHTPLDFEKLQKQYAKQDEQKTAAVRQRLFQLVKKDEEEILMKKHQEQLEKKRKEAYEEEQKRKKEEEKKRQQQVAEIPRGKIRRSIFTPLKVAKRQTAEVKPAAGKQ